MYVVHANVQCTVYVVHANLRGTLHVVHANLQGKVYVVRYVDVYEVIGKLPRLKHTSIVDEKRELTLVKLMKVEYLK